ncbi:hypothetical protein [Enterobacter mori]
MNKYHEDKLSEIALGEALLLLLKQHMTISLDILYQRLQDQLLDERDEYKKTGIIAALWELDSLREKLQLKQDNSREMHDVVIDSAVLKH